MSNTHSFKLPSGVECEVKELTGKHQRLLTEQKNKKMGDNLNELLADVIVRVGSKKGVDLNFVKSMLACDRKKALVEVRQFTLDFDPLFKFTYEYTDQNGIKQNHPLEIDLSDGFPMTTLKVINDQGILEDAKYKEYADIDRELKVNLPRSKKDVVVNLLDGRGEEMGMRTAKSSRSSHTAILMRNPKEYHKTSNDTIPIQVRLDDMSIKDIEFLRQTIKNVEGQVDTEIMVEHPEAEFKPASEKNVVVDILGVLAFFFPSEAI